jgi:hypothetical protein
MGRRLPGRCPRHGLRQRLDDAGEEPFPGGRPRIQASTVVADSPVCRGGELPYRCRAPDVPADFASIVARQLGKAEHPQN